MSGRKKEDWMTLSQLEINEMEDEDWEHYKDKGCICHAYDKSECVCGAWWVEEEE